MKVSVQVPMSSGSVVPGGFSYIVPPEGLLHVYGVPGVGLVASFAAGAWRAVRRSEDDE